LRWVFDRFLLRRGVLSRLNPPFSARY